MKNKFYFSFALVGLCLFAALIYADDVPLNRRRVRLNDGYDMPVLGFGTWTLNDDTARQCVYEAIRRGYRLIDTAAYYGNEKGVGEGIRRAITEGIVSREDIFVTTKVTPWGFSNYDAAIEACNERLGLGYIDLMLIHQSGADEFKLYRAIERAVKKGTVRSLGISNYYTQSEVDRITKGAKILPAVIQNENHPFYQNTPLQSYVKSFGAYIESYYPLGGRGHTGDVLGNKTISEIAKARGKTAAQIVIRWHLQSGYIAIPGSSNPAHIEENFQIGDFTLTEDELARISALHTGRRYENW